MYAVMNTSRPKLSSVPPVRSVNNEEISTLGQAEFRFNLGVGERTHKFIVADIECDGILGQDFLVKYARRIDYDKLELVLK